MTQRAVTFGQLQEYIFYEHIDSDIETTKLTLYAITMNPLRKTKDAINMMACADKHSV